jgi:peptidyl-prolyl cis-trans isomerase A (cyclophilin A)
MLYACLAALGLFGLLALTSGGAALADDKGQANPVVVLDTSEGAITLELEAAKAPKTVENFLKYVDDGFYNDTVFHRVIPGFMIQGGGPAKDTYREKETRGPVKNESANGLSNTRGTVAMARKPDPDSATAQFFINLGDNSRLDQAGGGYTVFGRVIDGMNVVDRIAAEPTGTQTLEMIIAPGQTRKIPADDVPTKPIIIKSVKRKGA